ncbi:MAG: hypothetical protein ABI656_04620, partial [bacterium]
MHFVTFVDRGLGQLTYNKNRSYINAPAQNMASKALINPISEFDLIARFFARPERGHPQLTLGIGDDCALL